MAGTIPFTSMTAVSLSPLPSSSADDVFFGVDVASPGAGDDPCDLVPPVGTAGSTVSGGGLSLPQSPSFLDAASAAAAI